MTRQHDAPIGFPITAATAADFAKRKPLYGVGINDAGYVTQPRVNGRLVRCPAYERWCSMLKRCYRPTGQHIKTYAGCSVAEVWHSFAAFRQWLTAHPGWQTLEIDKDIRVAGNRVYGPDTCILIPKEVNSLFLRQDKRSDTTLPVGVHPHRNRFKARLRVHGRMTHLGSFSTPEEASVAYLAAKRAHILSIATNYVEKPTIYRAILAAADRLH